MNYNGYGSLAGLTEYSQHSAPSYLENSYGAAYGDYGASRDVSGGGGYRYRQWDNGDIAILSGALPSGWRTGQPGPRGSAWNAIYAEIGPYPASSSVSITQSSPTSVSMDWKKGKGKGKGKDDDEPTWFETAAASFVEGFKPKATGTGVSQQSVDLRSPGTAKKAVPWGWIIGGTLGVGAIIAIAVYASGADRGFTAARDKRGKK